MHILELLEGVIRRPAETFKTIAEEKPVGWALAIFAASALLSSITADYSILEEYLDAPAPNVVLQIAGALIGLFILTGFLHLLSRIFKGTGGYWGLFAALGFAQFPGFLAPLAEVLKSLGGVAGAVLGGIISLGSAIWVLLLYVIALRESRGITTGASILTYLIAFFIVVAVVVMGVIFFVIVLGSLL